MNNHYVKEICFTFLLNICCVKFTRQSELYRTGLADNLISPQNMHILRSLTSQIEGTESGQIQCNSNSLCDNWSHAKEQWHHVISDFEAVSICHWLHLHYVKLSWLTIILPCAEKSKKIICEKERVKLENRQGYDSKRPKIEILYTQLL